MIFKEKTNSVLLCEFLRVTPWFVFYHRVSQSLTQSITEFNLSKKE